MHGAVRSPSGGRDRPEARAGFTMKKEKLLPVKSQTLLGDGKALGDQMVRLLCLLEGHH